MHSGIASFVHDLAHTGRITLPLKEPTEFPLSLIRELEETDERARAHAPGSAPEFDQPAAEWAAVRLHALCEAWKNPDAPGIFTSLRQPAPFSSRPSTIWSVHLLFRCLPDLQRLAGERSENDPWTEALERQFVAWPLAPIRTEATPDPIALAHIFDHPSLQRIYADLRAESS